MQGEVIRSKQGDAPAQEESPASRAHDAACCSAEAPDAASPGDREPADAATEDEPDAAANDDSPVRDADAALPVDAGRAPADAASATPRDAGVPSELARSACILPLGDSITQSDASHVSYRYWLWDKLRGSGTGFDLVGSLRTNFGGSPAFPSDAFDRDHEGHWGFRVDEVRDRLREWLGAYPVGIALVHLGTNDLIQGQSIDGTIAELGAVIDLLRQKNPQIAILLAQVIPTTYDANDALTQLNARIPALAQSKTSARSPVLVVDQSSGFDRAADTFDGVHPNERGEKKMAERWYAALRPLLQGARPCR